MWDELEKLKIEDLRGENPLVDKVARGETTLEEEIEKCEALAYEAATSRGIRKKDLAKCNQQLKTLTEIIDFFETTYNYGIKSDYYYTKRIDGAPYATGGMMSFLIGIFTCMLFPPLALPGLVAVLGSSSVIAASVVQDGSCYKAKNKQRWKEETESLFSMLKGEAKKADREIHETCLFGYYQNVLSYPNFNLFIETFSGMEESRQRQFIRMLIKQELKQEKQNNPLSMWISANYPQLVKEEGQSILLDYAKK